MNKTKDFLVCEIIHPFMLREKTQHKIEAAPVKNLYTGQIEHHIYFCSLCNIFFTAAEVLEIKLLS